MMRTSMRGARASTILMATDCASARIRDALVRSFLSALAVLTQTCNRRGPCLHSGSAVAVQSPARIKRRVFNAIAAVRDAVQ